MSKYMKVPEDILTGKDLDYLSDMFQWNYVAFKKTCQDLEMLQDEELISLFGEASDLFEENLNMVLDILNNPGGEEDE